jgi:hypothetical protein
LAAIEIPANLDEAIRALIKNSINDCFISGFRRIMLFGAALAFASSLIALLLIRRNNAT